MRLIAVAMLLALPYVAQAADTDPVVRLDGSDVEMNAAIARARSTLDDFLALSAHPPRGAHDFKLKVKFTDAHGVEHMWVTPFERHGHGFSGTLANEPDTVRNVRLWDEVRFERADITDWGYEMDGRQVGSFTVCVMFEHMRAEDVAAFRDRGFDCES